jgi:hypothetical protein
MAATYTTFKALNCCRRRMVDYDVDGALNVVDLGQPQAGTDKCVPIATHRRWVAGLFRSVGTGTVDAFNIFASTNAAGTGSATTVVAHAIGSAPDAVGDTIWLECDADQVHEVLPGATHVGVRVDLLTATDECVVFFEQHEPVFVGADPTADNIA